VAGKGGHPDHQPQRTVWP